MPDILNSKKLTPEILAAKPWGPAFLREVDLVIAQGIVSAEGTLYQDELSQRVGEFCLPLDAGVRDDYIGIIAIEPDPEREWARVDEALAKLVDKPHGTWAVFKKDGQYDAFMSNGNGGVGTTGGHMFMYTGSDAPAFNFQALYGSTLSTIVYQRRNAIGDEIARHSAAVSGVTSGTIVKDVYLGSKRYSRVEFQKVVSGHFVGNADAYQVKVTRPGVKPQEILLDPVKFMSVFDVPMQLPPAYAAAADVDRRLSLSERRTAAAKALTLDFLETGEAGADASMGGPLKRGDRVEFSVFTGKGKDFASAGSYAVEFGPGGVEVLDSSWTPEAASPKP